MEILSDSTLWKYYLLFTGIISLIIGIIWYFRFEKMKHSEKFHNVFWNSFIQYFGFFLVFFQIQILITIFRTENLGKISVLAVLLILSLFISLFCLSGRGIQILQGALNKGIKEIKFGWNGITIEFNES